MEFADVVRMRRMVRRFRPDPVPEAALRRILVSALHAPSAGFSQGLELIVLSRALELEEFWRITDPWRRKGDRTDGEPPVIVIPLAAKGAYLRRYSELDKKGLGLDREEGWPVPYWDLDAAMGVMLMLLAAVDEGLGGWYFGIFRGEEKLRKSLGIPAGFRPIGALAIGYPHAEERATGSALSRRRRPFDEVVHRGRFTRARTFLE